MNDGDYMEMIARRVARDSETRPMDSDVAFQTALDGFNRRHGPFEGVRVVREDDGMWLVEGTHADGATLRGVFVKPLTVQGK